MYVVRYRYSAGGYDPFGKPTVYGGSSNLGLVPETYLLSLIHI